MYCDHAFEINSFELQEFDHSGEHDSTKELLLVADNATTWEDIIHL